jgi:hypothetical protein
VLDLPDANPVLTARSAAHRNSPFDDCIVQRHQPFLLIRRVRYQAVEVAVADVRAHHAREPGGDKVSLRLGHAFRQSARGNAHVADVHLFFPPRVTRHQSPVPHRAKVTPTPRVPQLIELLTGRREPPRLGAVTFRHLEHRAPVALRAFPRVANKF